MSRAFPPRILGKLERIKGKTTFGEFEDFAKGWRVRSLKSESLNASSLNVSAHFGA